ncbi:Acetylgalactosaminyl-O-glycosyl-glycoprotein beta-1,3-N-acetylglucosaminyltransferase [Liparis tanakae]|uniref:Acetylgalactosaminyl-O-glycosyl-glycoprotein beta-1,3-N-acetylglucosaminyltransferase n=1 Tax=Liparis tanakae TaxID=230148 RepID=A0A4Z2IP45_9TELE|nr:Acetylgalactosaminyl-O-glycosyl-glycoprotein beta-1,3-N-acetylglucosaminyltransferase [Liparis tanakae]
MFTQHKQEEGWGVARGNAAEEGASKSKAKDLLLIHLYLDAARDNRLCSAATEINWSDAQISPLRHEGKSRCEQNIPAANIKNFHSLPVIIKKILYYRHCRHFPMPLDVNDKCGGADGSAGVFFLPVIKSSPDNYNRREVLRNT